MFCLATPFTSGDWNACRISLQQRSSRVVQGQFAAAMLLRAISLQAWLQHDISMCGWLQRTQGPMTVIMQTACCWCHRAPHLMLLVSIRSSAQRSLHRAQSSSRAVTKSNTGLALCVPDSCTTSAAAVGNC